MSTQAQHPLSQPQTGGTREFWKPQRPAAFRVEKCESCGNEMIVGSRFCHLCGTERDANPRGTASQHYASIVELFDWTYLRRRIGLSTASLVLMLVGFCFAVAALLTGAINTANTALDWQAIQMWRIEWMLAALVAFTAGILLKRN